ncbi:hypothetical protein D3C79_632910 [compost metagenome]
MVQQRRAAKVIKGHYLAHQDPVIATVQLLVLFTLKARRAIGEQRRAASAGLVVDTGKAIFLRAGKVVGQVDLVRSQDVHGKVRGFLEHFMAGRALVDAPQDQRRVQRHRVEAVGGNADLAATGAGGSHHRHAGGKVAQGAAEGT